MELYLYKAKIVGVYDGDTYTALVDLGFGITTQMKLRAFGIDTPEMRGDEKIEGKRVRDYVRNLILSKEVVIRTVKDKKGKYGRYLAEVFFKFYTDDNGEVHWVNLNQHLIERNDAKIFLLNGKEFTKFEG